MLNICHTKDSILINNKACSFKKKFFRTLTLKEESNLLTGIKLKFSDSDVRDFIFNGEQWIDFDHSDPETVKALEEDSKKKSRYMTKDPQGKIQVKDRL